MGLLVYQHALLFFIVSFYLNSTDSITPCGASTPGLWYSISLNSPVTSNILNTYIIAVLYFWYVVSSQDQHLARCSHPHLIPQIWVLLNSPGTNFYNIIMSINVSICMCRLTSTAMSWGRLWVSNLDHLPLARILIGRCWVNHVPNLRHLQWPFQTICKCRLSNTATSWECLGFYPWPSPPGKVPYWQVLGEPCPQP